MKIASDQGYQTIYARTVVGADILEPLGWALIKTVFHRDEEISLYRWDLKQ